MEVVFRFSTAALTIEVAGPEGFARPHIEFLMPYVRRVTGAATAADAGPAPVGLQNIAAWWNRTVPATANPSLQDTILLFAYYMRTYRKTVFVSEDIRRCFSVMGLEEPKSLLQILGTLKREHGFLLNAGRRGEYMMNVTGIARARAMLGERRDGDGAAAPTAGPGPKAPDAKNLFRD